MSVRRWGHAAAAGVALALLWHEPISAQEGGEEAAASSGGFDGGEILAGFAFLVAAIIVIAIGLWFSSTYHERLFASIDKAVKGGNAGSISTDSQESYPSALSGTTIGVSGPATVAVGSSVTFVASGATDNDAVSWTVEGGDASPNHGTGQSLGVTFASLGVAKVTAAEAGKTSVPLQVSVVAATSSARQGIVLPFVIKNWARFVVVIFGVGVIGALMALGVVSSEAGIGVLGALLGIGGATATAESESRPADRSDGAATGGTS